MTEQIPSIEPNVPGRDGRKGLLLRVPYRTALVNELKARLPHTHRYWDAGIMAWWIDTWDEARTTDIVLHHFAALVLLGGPGEEDRVLSRNHGEARQEDTR